MAKDYIGAAVRQMNSGGGLPGYDPGAARVTTPSPTPAPRSRTEQREPEGAYVPTNSDSFYDERTAVNAQEQVKRSAVRAMEKIKKEGAHVRPSEMAKLQYMARTGQNPQSPGGFAKILEVVSRPFQMGGLFFSDLFHDKNTVASTGGESLEEEITPGDYWRVLSGNKAELAEKFYEDKPDDFESRIISEEGTLQAGSTRLFGPTRVEETTEGDPFSGLEGVQETLARQTGPLGFLTDILNVGAGATDAIIGGVMDPERGLQGLAGFTYDVATDPFSYPFAGAGTLGKSTALQAASAIGRRTAAEAAEALVRNVSDDLIRSALYGADDFAETVAKGLSAAQVTGREFTDDVILASAKRAKADLPWVLDDYFSSLRKGGAELGDEIVPQTRRIVEDTVSRAVDKELGLRGDKIGKAIAASRYDKVPQSFIDEAKSMEGRLGGDFASGHLTGGLRVGVPPYPGLIGKAYQFSWSVPGTRGLGRKILDKTLYKAGAPLVSSQPKVLSVWETLRKGFGNKYSHVMRARAGKLFEGSVTEARAAEVLREAGIPQQQARQEAAFDDFAQTLRKSKMKSKDRKILREELVSEMQKRGQRARKELPTEPRTFASSLDAVPDDVARAASTLLGVTDEYFDTLWALYRRFDPDAGVLAAYSPFVLTKKMKRWVELLADKGVRVNPSQSHGHALLDELVASAAARKGSKQAEVGTTPHARTREFGVGQAAVADERGAVLYTSEAATSSEIDALLMDALKDTLAFRDIGRLRPNFHAIETDPLTVWRGYSESVTRAIEERALVQEMMRVGLAVHEDPFYRVGATLRQVLAGEEHMLENLDSIVAAAEKGLNDVATPPHKIKLGAGRGRHWEVEIPSYVWKDHKSRARLAPLVEKARGALRADELRLAEWRRTRQAKVNELVKNGWDARDAENFVFSQLPDELADLKAAIIHETELTLRDQESALLETLARLPKDSWGEVEKIGELFQGMARKGRAAYNRAAKDIDEAWANKIGRTVGETYIHIGPEQMADVAAYIYAQTERRFKQVYEALATRHAVLEEKFAKKPLREGAEATRAEAEFAELDSWIMRELSDAAEGTAADRAEFLHRINRELTFEELEDELTANALQWIEEANKYYGTMLTRQIEESLDWYGVPISEALRKRLGRNKNLWGPTWSDPELIEAVAEMSYREARLLPIIDDIVDGVPQNEIAAMVRFAHTHDLPPMTAADVISAPEGTFSKPLDDLIEDWWNARPERVRQPFEEGFEQPNWSWVDPEHIPEHRLSTASQTVDDLHEAFPTKKLYRTKAGKQIADKTSEAEPINILPVEGTVDGPITYEQVVADLQGEQLRQPVRMYRTRAVIADRDSKTTKQANLLDNMTADELGELADDELDALAAQALEEFDDIHLQVANQAPQRETRTLVLDQYSALLIKASRETGLPVPVQMGTMDWGTRRFTFAVTRGDTTVTPTGRLQNWLSDVVEADVPQLRPDRTNSRLSAIAELQQRREMMMGAWNNRVREVRAPRGEAGRRQALEHRNITRHLEKVGELERQIQSLGESPTAGRIENLRAEHAARMKQIDNYDWQISQLRGKRKAEPRIREIETAKIRLYAEASAIDEEVQRLSAQAAEQTVDALRQEQQAHLARLVRKENELNDLMRLGGLADEADWYFMADGPEFINADGNVERLLQLRRVELIDEPKPGMATRAEFEQAFEDFPSTGRLPEGVSVEAFEAAAAVQSIDRTLGELAAVSATGTQMKAAVKRVREASEAWDNIASKVRPVMEATDPSKSAVRAARKSMYSIVDGRRVWSSDAKAVRRAIYAADGDYHQWNKIVDSFDRFEAAQEGVSRRWLDQNRRMMENMNAYGDTRKAVDALERASKSIQAQKRETTSQDIMAMLETMDEFTDGWQRLMQEYHQFDILPDGTVKFRSDIDPEGLLQDQFVQDLTALRKLARQLGMDDKVIDSLKPVRRVTTGPDGFVPASQVGLAGPTVRGLYFEANTATLMENMITNMEALYTPMGLSILRQSTSSAMRAWKGWATVVRPTFHVRNLMGGVWNNLLVGVGPREYWAMRHYGKFKKTLKATGDMDKALQKVPKAWQPHFKALELSGTVDTGFAHSELRALYTGREGVFKGLQPWSGQSYPMQAGAEAMESVETLLRGAAFLRHYNPLVRESEAFAKSMAYAVHFDYQHLTEMERQIKRFIPFFVWTKNNLPLQMRALLYNPRMMLTHKKFVDNMADRYEDPEYRDFADSQWRSPFAFGTNFTLNSETPYWGRIVIDPDFPFLDLFEMEDFSANSALHQVANLLGPQVTLPVQMMLQQDYDDVPVPSPISNVTRAFSQIPLLNVGYDTAQGDRMVARPFRTLYEGALPWWPEYEGLAAAVAPNVPEEFKALAASGSPLAVLAPTDAPTAADRAQRAGFTEERTAAEGVRAAALRLGRGVGVGVQTPIETKGNARAATDWVYELVKRLRREGELAPPE